MFKKNFFAHADHWLRKNRDRIFNIKRAAAGDVSYELKREIINNYRAKYKLDLFIETGTFMGGTVDFFKDSFKKIYSIELSKELAEKAKMKFENDKHIIIVQGDSGEVLKPILEKDNETALFWLDGHYSSEFFIGDEYIVTARSEKNTPILKELETIFSTSQPHIILIDDARCFNGRDDYPSFSKLKKLVRANKKNYNIFVEKDIIHIIPVENKKDNL